MRGSSKGAPYKSGALTSTSYSQRSKGRVLGPLGFSKWELDPKPKSGCHIHVRLPSASCPGPICQSTQQSCTGQEHMTHAGQEHNTFGCVANLGSLGGVWRLATPFAPGLDSKAPVPADSFSMLPLSTPGLNMFKHLLLKTPPFVFLL